MKNEGRVRRADHRLNRRVWRGLHRKSRESIVRCMYVDWAPITLAHHHLVIGRIGPSAQLSLQLHHFVRHFDQHIVWEDDLNYVPAHGCVNQIWQFNRRHSLGRESHKDDERDAQNDLAS